MGSSPKFLLEILISIIFFVLIIFFIDLDNREEILQYIPILSFVLLASFRIPACQSIFMSLTDLRTDMSTYQQVLTDLDNLGINETNKKRS